MKKIIIFIIVFVIAMCTIFIQIEPEIQSISDKEINRFLQLIINHVSFTKKIDETQLYKSTQTIQFNMIYLNKVASQYVERIEDTLIKIEQKKYHCHKRSLYEKELENVSKNQGIIASIPVGALTHIALLSYLGPRIHVKYKTLSLVSSKINKSIKSYGINHISVDISLNMTIQLQILVPLNNHTYAKKYHIPLVFQIIEGEVPTWYQS